MALLEIIQMLLHVRNKLGNSTRVFVLKCRKIFDIHALCVFLYLSTYFENETLTWDFFPTASMASDGRNFISEFCKIFASPRLKEAGERKKYNERYTKKRSWQKMRASFFFVKISQWCIRAMLENYCSEKMPFLLAVSFEAAYAIPSVFSCCIFFPICRETCCSGRGEDFVGFLCFYYWRILSTGPGSKSFCCFRIFFFSRTSAPPFVRLHGLGLDRAARFRFYSLIFRAHVDRNSDPKIIMTVTCRCLKRF